MSGIYDGYVTGARGNVQWTYSFVGKGPPWITFAAPLVQHAASRIAQHAGVRKVSIAGGPCGLMLCAYLSRKQPVVGLSMRRVAEDIALAIHTGTGVVVSYGSHDPENVDDRWLPLNPSATWYASAIHWTIPRSVRVTNGAPSTAPEAET